MQYKTLFLDRDGVINRRTPGDYVRRWDEFSFLPGVLESLPVLAAYFERIVVVTNQAGVKKGLMSANEVNHIHETMLRVVQRHGGRIDRVYFCPDYPTETAPCRKPNPGMAYQAKQDYPEIDFATSVIVGDSPSDMEFGKRLGMYTAFIDNPEDPEQAHLPEGYEVGMVVESLAAFTQGFCS